MADLPWQNEGARHRLLKAIKEASPLDERDSRHKELMLAIAELIEERVTLISTHHH